QQRPPRSLRAGAGGSVRQRGCALARRQGGDVPWRGRRPLPRPSQRRGPAQASGGAAMSTIAPPSRRRRLWGWALLFVVVPLAAGGYWLWQRSMTPVPPAVALEGADPEVVQVIEAARAAAAAAPRSGSAWGHLGMVLLAHGCAAEAAVCFGN